jgi:hypothetical protein
VILSANLAQVGITLSYISKRLKINWTQDDTNLTQGGSLTFSSLNQDDITLSQGDMSSLVQGAITLSQHAMSGFSQDDSYLDQGGLLTFGAATWLGPAG